jgi:hypothetical protein
MYPWSSGSTDTIWLVDVQAEVEFRIPEEYKGKMVWRVLLRGIDSKSMLNPYWEGLIHNLRTLFIIKSSKLSILSNFSVVDLTMFPDLWSLCSEFTAQLKVDQTLNRISTCHLRCFFSNVHEVMDMWIGSFMRRGETCWLLWRLVPATETKS